MLSQQVTDISLGNYVLAFLFLRFALPDIVVLNSLEELCITRLAAVTSFVRVLNPRVESVYMCVCVCVCVDVCVLACV